MPNISLKDWVILLTIIPTTLISFGLAGYFSYSRAIELNSFLEQRSKSIIEPIAIASKDALLEKNRDKLRKLISFTHRNQSDIVKSIVIFTDDNQVVVTSAYHSDTNLLRLTAGTDLPSHTSVEHTPDHLIFRTPIIDEYFNTSPNLPVEAVNRFIEPIRQNNKPHTLGYIAIQIDKSRFQFQQQSQFIQIDAKYHQMAFQLVLVHLPLILEEQLFGHPGQMVTDAI